jgi:hypothetical protein
MDKNDIEFTVGIALALLFWLRTPTQVRNIFVQKWRPIVALILSAVILAGFVFIVIDIIRTRTIHPFTIVIFPMSLLGMIDMLVKLLHFARFHRLTGFRKEMSGRWPLWLAIGAWIWLVIGIWIIEWPRWQLSLISTGLFVLGIFSHTLIDLILKTFSFSRRLLIQTHHKIVTKSPRKPL